MNEFEKKLKQLEKQIALWTKEKESYIEKKNNNIALLEEKKKEANKKLEDKFNPIIDECNAEVNKRAQYIETANKITNDILKKMDKLAKENDEFDNMISGITNG